LRRVGSIEEENVREIFSFSVAVTVVAVRSNGESLGELVRERGRSLCVRSCIPSGRISLSRERLILESGVLVDVHIIWWFGQREDTRCQ
jgi:hypothetical protein